MRNPPVIAVADDNPVSREALGASLVGLCDVVSFESGQAVLDHLAHTPVDLLLLDVRMPDMDGYETCQALRAGRTHPDLPVIFISVRANLDDRLKGYAAGGNDYLTKPCDVDELKAKVLLAVDNHRRMRMLAGEVDQLNQAVSLTSEMLGEVGVVLEFQRAMTACDTPEALADALLATLFRFGLEGSIRMTTSRATVTRSAVGRTSTLETSLLDHLAARPDLSVVTMGQNLGFSFGSVTLIVRCLAWAAAPDAPQTLDAMGRARDNVALLVDGAVARLQALDGQHDARQLTAAHSLIGLTRHVLRDIEVAEHELHRALDGVFTAMRGEFEFRFPQLGLTGEQEDSLAGILQRHHADGLAVLERGRVVEEHLHRLVAQLEQSQQPRAGLPDPHQLGGLLLP